tara:strand:- start:5675 stop:6394 length:720 start_codon:yes stop_codon:yes gene_type:complete
MPALLAAAAIASAVTGIASAITAARAAKKARKRAETAEKSIKRIERNRAVIINPYDNVKNLSGMASNVSGMASNPYANLSVATGAAEMQAQQTDIALANTLDTLRATGSSAGGATALAQAALQSKQGIAADIQSQEVRNAELEAKGQQALEQIQMTEEQRMQGINMGEAARIQNAEVLGKSYKFASQEQRDANDLARYAAKEQNASAEQNAYKSATMSAMTGTMGNLTNIAIAAPIKKK